MKKALTALSLLAFTAINIYALDPPFFTGYTGISGNLSGAEGQTSFEPELTTTSFFAGQLDFSGKLLLTGEFYLDTGNLISDGLFSPSGSTSYNSYLQIEEFSATYKISSIGAVHNIGVFLGNYEPIGSDIFLQRQFGIDSVNSRLTESWCGINGASIYPFYGAGLSYLSHFSSPIAAGAYMYLNTDEGDTDGTYNTIFNFDGRISMAYPSFTMDAAAGFGFRNETSTETGTKVFLLVREISLHGGISMLIGNQYSTSLFIQGGFSDWSLLMSDSSASQLKFADIYALFEPRFVFKFMEIDLSLFNLPDDTVENMNYLKCFTDSTLTGDYSVLGANISVLNDHLYMGDLKVTLGMHVTFAFTNPDISGYMAGTSTFTDWEKGLVLTPFFEIPIPGGTFSTSLSADCLKFTTDPYSAFFVCCGFRTKL